MVTPKYFKFYQVGTLRNDETDLMVEEHLDKFLRIRDDSNEMDYNPTDEVVEVTTEESKPVMDSVTDDDDDQMSVEKGTAMIAQ
jgi:hypothetical protein